MSPHTLIGSRFHHYVARCVKQGHRLVESGRLGATVTELRRGREIGNIRLHVLARPRRSSVTVAPQLEKGDGPDA